MQANNANQPKFAHGRFAKAPASDLEKAFRDCFTEDGIAKFAANLEKIALDTAHKHHVRALIYLVDKLTKSDEQSQPGAGKPQFVPLSGDGWSA